MRLPATVFSDIESSSPCSSACYQVEEEDEKVHNATVKLACHEDGEEEAPCFAPTCHYLACQEGGEEEARSAG